MLTTKYEPLNETLAAPKISTVIALTIVAPKMIHDDGPEGLDVLIGVRRPETNGNHKNVASVPTIRVSDTVFDSIYDRWEASQDTNKTKEIPDRLLNDVVESVLSRKLGLADPLEYGQVEFDATPSVYKEGTSPLLSDGDQPDAIRMLNILVELRQGREYIPESTASYSALRWFDINEAMNCIDKEELFVFDDVANPTRYICGGLCICTSEILLKQVEAQ